MLDLEIMALVWALLTELTEWKAEVLNERKVRAKRVEARIYLYMWLGWEYGNTYKINYYRIKHDPYIVVLF